MSQELLEGADICTSLQEMSGKGMAKGMGRDSFREPGLLRSS